MSWLVYISPTTVSSFPPTHRKCYSSVFNWFQKCDHVTHILAPLHLLHVPFRIYVKKLNFWGLAPFSYFQTVFPHDQMHPLRSSDKALLSVPKSGGPGLWNTLPEEMRHAGSVPYFKWLLETHLWIKQHLQWFSIVMLLFLFFLSTHVFAYCLLFFHSYW